MSSVVVILAHPNFGQSHINRALADMVGQVKGVTLHDLYQMYPDGIIDIAAEQALISQAHTLVFQHPLYWYSCPALLKEWMDLVLQFNFAYGAKGEALSGKRWLTVTTTGGRAQAYSKEGHNRFSMRDFLRPFEQTAFLCHMNYLPPLVIHGARQLSKDEKELDEACEHYRSLLKQLADPDFDPQLAQNWPSRFHALCDQE